MATATPRTQSTKERISLVVPCFNEEKAIGGFLDVVLPIIESITSVDWEVVFVDDGSRDETLNLLSLAAKADTRIRVLGLSRNFGKEAALTAGLHAASGDALIPMDVDLQDPPTLLGELVCKYQEGWPIVQAVRRGRSTDTWLKRTTAKMFYAFVRGIAAYEVCPDAGDFQLLSRQVVEEIKLYPEHNRFMKGITAAVGFPRCKVYFDRQARTQGNSKFGFWKLWNFALDGITSFTTLPLRIWFYLGLVTSVFAFGWGAWLVIRTLVAGVVTPGFISTIVAVLFIGGIQLLGIGIIGEYIGRISVEVRNRPIYHIAYDSQPN